MAGLIELRNGDPNGTFAVVKVRNLGMINCPVTHMDVATRILGLLKQLFTEEDKLTGPRENVISAERTFRYGDAVFEVQVSFTTYRPLSDDYDPYGVFVNIDAYLLQVSRQAQQAVRTLQQNFPATPIPGIKW